MGSRRLGGGGISAAALTVTALAVLAGCAATVKVPVADQTHNAARSDGTHIVRRGETLYSIAWGAGVDYRALARWNGISAPYVIRPGQRLRLTRPPGAPPPAAKPAPPKPPPRAQARRAPPAKRALPQPPPTSLKGWAWPANGRLVRRFSARGNKGIDIAGRYGQGVFAAAAGRVVYAGSGLRGYGKLIIVKHNEVFLSAYAHNRKISVAEGDRVSRGQRIAEMGSTGTNQIKLHFEIRRRGVPVDPLRYLPKR